MSSWIGWSTTNLDAVGILLQRLGSLSIGIAVGMNLANYFATATFVCTVIALSLGPRSVLVSGTPGQVSKSKSVLNSE
jgi:hypothetical protein